MGICWNREMNSHSPSPRPSPIKGEVEVDWIIFFIIIGNLLHNFWVFHVKTQKKEFPSEFIPRARPSIFKNNYLILANYIRSKNMASKIRSNHVPGICFALDKKKSDLISLKHIFTIALEEE
ncbi:MAG: hypothetical protein FP814_05350 [Desulfobacterium sp.]|nr:hypothetical protein [Desulfobacterium sp.]